MNAVKDIKYPGSFDKPKKVYYDFGSVVKFLESNQGRIATFKINPPKLGSDNFGSVEITVKKR